MIWKGWCIVMTDIKRYSLYFRDKKKERYERVCVRVCWLDIHVALIIVPLLLGSHSGIGQALMWV